LGQAEERALNIEIPDETLLARGAEGDETAFRLLVERWEGAVGSFLFRMLGSREEAEDLAQETFMRMIAAAPRYRDSGQFRSWLLRIAGNLARSRLRRRRLVRWLSLEQAAVDPPVAGPDALDRLEADQRRQRLRSAVGRLPDRQREALVLRQDHDMSYREIADTMGVTVGSVQMLLHRALTALRRDLGQQEETA
jgi:RNA polymerase sigma-70 factor (ECF subfamily)